MYAWEVVARYRVGDVAEVESSSARAKITSELVAAGGLDMRIGGSALTVMTFMAESISIISLSCEKSCAMISQLMTLAVPFRSTHEEEPLATSWEGGFVRVERAVRRRVVFRRRVGQSSDELVDPSRLLHQRFVPATLALSLSLPTTAVESRHPASACKTLARLRNSHPWSCRMSENN